MAMHACQIGPTDTAPPCPGSPQRACVETKGVPTKVVRIDDAKTLTESRGRDSLEAWERPQP